MSGSLDGISGSWRRGFDWIEAELGGTIVRAERQARWRPAWTLDLQREGEVVPLYFRGERGETDQPRDFLTSLIEARDPDSGYRYSLHELVGEVTGLFIAGHETTGSVIAWALYMMAECPDIQRKLQHEAQSVFAGRSPEYSDIRKLVLARDILREALRLYPPVSLLFREPLHQDEFRKTSVCPHSLVVVSPWIVQRHDAYWERPHEFDPFRYGTEAGKVAVKSAYLPFNIGPRTCLGLGIAMQEGALVLAALAERFHFRPDPSRTPQPAAKMTLRAENGIHLFAIPHSPAEDGTC